MLKEKILLFIDWFTPAYKAGGPIRSCANFAQAMAGEYQLYIITSNTDLEGEKLDVEANKWIEFAPAIQVQYVSKDRQRRGYFEQLIAAISPNYIYLNSMFSASFTLMPLLLGAMKRTDAQYILAPRGMLHEGAMQYKALKKKALLTLLRNWPGRHQIRYQATDAQEVQDIARHLKVKATRIHQVSNLPQAALGELVKYPKEKGKLRLVFISRVAPKKNLLFVLTCLAQLPTDIQVDLSVYGGIEEGYWTACATMIDKLPPSVTVTYKGAIPNSEVGTVLQAHHFFILSTFGENFGHAIFESFAAGRPVLISDQTPWRVLSAQQIGWDIPLSDERGWMSALKAAAAMDQDTYDTWCKAAWEYAHDYIHNSSLKQKYLELFSTDENR